ncbi:MAG: asparagine--tRNA ligase [Verrucomicrobiota bacterium]
MPTIVEIRNLPQFDQQEVTLRGWLYGKRSGGKILFLLVRDGTGTCQCVLEARQQELFQTASALGQESSLAVSGRVRLDPRAPGGCELEVTDLKVVQPVQDYPIARKAHGIDFLMDHRHLWLRSPRQTAILRIRHSLIRAARQFFDDQGFTLIDTPILSPGAAEGTGTLFGVDYFGEQVYLAQTGQLYVESACLALGKVYCFGPTFRAEKSKTRRHLTEFWMIEPEIAFAEIGEVMDWAERFVCHLVQAVLRDHRDDLALLERDAQPLEKVAPPFPRITYTQAVELLHDPKVIRQMEEQLEQERVGLQAMIGQLAGLEAQKAQARQGWQQDKLAQQIQDLRDDIRDLEAVVAHRPEHIQHAREFAWGEDFGGDEETVIARHFEKPVIISEYPSKIKAFYMKRSPSNPDVVLNLDMLAPEGYGEIIGGSQREDDLEALQASMAENGMDPKPYEWYLDLRRYGSVPHGGFGLGLERTVAWICGLKHIRETIPFPRLMGRIYP